MINSQFFRYCYHILLQNNITHILKVDCDEFLYLNNFSIPVFEPVFFVKLLTISFCHTHSKSSGAVYSETNTV